MNKDKTHYYKPSVTKGEYVSEKELIENLVYPDTMYKKQIQELEQQLQECKEQKYNQFIEYVKRCDEVEAYKEKEDKLRKYINLHKTVLPLEYSTVDYIDYLMDCEPILQILNEGYEINE